LSADPRRELVRAAIRWCGVSVVWALLAGGLSLAVGVGSGSVALAGFGCDSIIDGTASAVLVWRFHQEDLDASRARQVERRAARVVAVTLLLVAAYLVAGAGVALVTGTGPSKTTLGAALSAASLVVLPVLAYKKLRLSRDLDSRALHSDGVLSAAGGLLAGTTLLGLFLSTGLGWWWSDSVAALTIAAVLVREGLCSWPSSR
jgi:divalent metal cation (Fe/Co/Zn/Cd) transporter